MLCLLCSVCHKCSLWCDLRVLCVYSVLSVPFCMSHVFRVYVLSGQNSFKETHGVPLKCRKVKAQKYVHNCHIPGT